MPAGASLSGSLGETERAELVRLRAEVLQLQDRRAALKFWWPGQPVPEGAEPFTASFEADYDMGVREKTREEIQRQEARRQAAAHGYRKGTTDQYPGTLADSCTAPGPGSGT